MFERWRRMAPDLMDIAAFQTLGYAVLADVVPSDIIADAIRHTDDLRSGAGTRRLLDARWCSELAERLASEPRLARFTPPNAKPVQCTYFTKSKQRNWLVSLHQDLSIPVARRVESDRCTGWSEKEEDLFVQPPVEVLREMVAIRLHLDDCDESNGALRVVPGSHRLGRLVPAEAAKPRDAADERCVAVARGGALIMRPLLLHASSKTSMDAPRRVLHFVFGPATLPEGLEWPSRKRTAMVG